MDVTDVQKELAQFLSLREQIKFLSERETEIKLRLKAAAEKLGEVDGKGHIVLQVGDNKLTNQRKVSNPLNAELAEKIITEKGLLDECMPFVRKLDQDALMAAYYKDLLTEEEIESMFPEKVSYAFLVQ
jgi:hypothetical protein